MTAFSEAYPPELLAAREEKLRRFWAGDGPRAVVSLHDSEFNYRQIEGDDLIVENAVKSILASANLSEDYLPWFGPDFGTISTARAFGGEIIHPDGGNIFIKPIISDPEEADAAVAGDPAGGDVAHAIALAARVRERLGTDKLWCRGVDMQGPLSTVSLLWEQEDLLCSMYTDPEPVHRLLDRVTDHLIAIMHAQEVGMGPMCGSVWPYVWLPQDLGVVITEDMMPLMSPELYKEFGLPYVKRIADEFNGVFVHCCGAFSQHLDNIAASGINYRGIEYWEPYMKTEEIFEKLGPSLVYNPNNSDDENLPQYQNRTAFLKYLSTVAPAEMRFYFTLETAWDRARENAALARELFVR